MPRKCARESEVIFFLDPLESLHGPLKPPFLIAKELRRCFTINMVSPAIDNDVAEVLDSFGFNALDKGERFCFSGSLLTFEAWLRKTKLRLKRTNCIVVNFSQCFLTDADIYYAQGPMTDALDDMFPELRPIYRVAYKIMRPFLARNDKVFNKNLRERSRLVVANSTYCAKIYEKLGIRVDEVIYPPLDCEQFKPTTSRPSGDYVLAYAGKETRYSVLKNIVEANIQVKVFGSKAPHIPRYLFKHPNIEFLGRVSDKQLVDLYSNALYTLFVFTHEPFGYIPIESMACGTPVLTYGMQGPSESVINGQTGWLVKGDRELVDLASKIWKEGHSQETRKNCRERALRFDAKKISRTWLKTIDELADPSQSIYETAIARENLNR